MAVKYHAKVERDGRFWLIHVVEIDRYTQARNLGEVHEMAADLVASMEDVDPAIVELEIETILPASVRRHLSRAEGLRREAYERNSQAAQESREAARELVGEYRLTLREAGTLLGISRQRVQQLVRS